MSSTGEQVKSSKVACDQADCAGVEIEKTIRGLDDFSVQQIARRGFWRATDCARWILACDKLRGGDFSVQQIARGGDGNDNDRVD